MENLNSFAQLIRYIRTEILPAENNLLHIYFDDYSMVLSVYDREIPIHITYGQNNNVEANRSKIEATLLTELIKSDLTSTELFEIGSICSLIENCANLIEPFIMRKE